MKRFLLILVVFTLLLSTVYADTTDNMIMNTDYFGQLTPQDVVASEENRIVTVAMVYMYALAEQETNSKNQASIDFINAYNDNFGDMKVAITHFRKNFTYVVFAFRNGEIYVFEAVHYPKLQMPRVAENPYIKITQLKDKQYYYEHFQEYLASMEEQGQDKDSSLSMHFFEISAYDVMTGILQVYDTVNGK